MNSLEKGIHDPLMNSEIPDYKLQSAWGAAAQHRRASTWDQLLFTGLNNDTM